jgi:hypothetical protein
MSTLRFMMVQSKVGVAHLFDYATLVAPPSTAALIKVPQKESGQARKDLE